MVTKKISTFNCCESGGTSEDAPVMGAEQQQLADEICEDCDTDAEKVQAIYGWIIHSFEYDKEKQPEGGVAYDKAKETKTLRIL